MSKMTKTIQDKLLRFSEDNISMPDLESRISNFLFSQIINDLKDKGIKTFGEWLKYYSTEGNDFEEVVVMSEAYYYKALRRDFDSISLEEKILVYNAIALYCIEMDIERPTGKLFGMIINTFIEIVRHYNLSIKGYLSLKGDVLISDRSKSQFYSVWSNGSTFKREMPITLFKENE